MNAGPTSSAIVALAQRSTPVERAAVGLMLLGGEPGPALDRLAVDWLADGPARLVLAAVRNVEARGEAVELATVEREIIRSGSPRDMAADAVTTVVGANATGCEDREALVDQIELDHLARVAALRMSAAHSRVRDGADPISTLRDLVDEGRALVAGAGGRREVGRHPAGLIDAILDGARRPPLALKVAGAQPVAAEVPFGELLTLTGPTGSGKSALALQMSSNAAMDGVHVVYASAELLAPALFARIAAQRLGCGWSDVLTGRVPRAHLEQAAAGLERLTILDGQHATVDGLARALRAVPAGERALGIVDYLQILPGAQASNRDERARVAAVVEELRRLAQATGAAIVVVSQASRASSRALRSGESTGAATTDAGAESAQIERAAAVTLALGSMGDAGADGYAPAPIHGGKSRYSAGDRTIAAWFHGASGRWRIDEDARPASVARAESSARAADAKIEQTKLALRQRATDLGKPTTRKELGAGFRSAVATASIQSLLADGQLVEVRLKASAKSTAWLLTSPEIAQATGLSLVKEAT